MELQESEGVKSMMTKWQHAQNMDASEVENTMWLMTVALTSTSLTVLYCHLRHWCIKLLLYFRVYSMSHFSNLIGYL